MQFERPTPWTWNWYLKIDYFTSNFFKKQKKSFCPLSCLNFRPEKRGFFLFLASMEGSNHAAPFSNPAGLL